MPSKMDREFIENLQNFTQSLESIVELLKKQADKGDLIDKMVASMDGAKMEEIQKDIREILDVSKDTNNNTKKILDEIKASRKQKESGLFGKIQDKENKNKIVDGVKVILLIAGGVLAIGMAFKLIGKVDFLSVVGLSIGILMISKAFADIAKIKDLNPKKAALVGLSVVIMATALTLSSYILAFFRPIGLLTSLSIIMVSAALGVASFSIFKAAKNINPKDFPKYLMLPAVLPLVAAGIALSSFFLKDTYPIGLKQGLSAIIVAAILAVASVSIMFLMKSLKDVTISKMLMTTAMIPLIATGIVLASLILQGFQPIKNPFKLLIGSLMIGVAILAFAPAIWLLGKLDIKQMLIGALAVPVVSLAIVASSWILSVGNYNDNVPDFGWSLKVGLALIAFTIPVILLGIIGQVGGIAALAIGSLMVLGVSAVIVATSWILSLGKYDGQYPSVGWSLGVGLGLLTFGIPLLLLGAIAMTGIGLVALAAGAASSLIVSSTIVATSHILSSGDYGNYPSFGWAAGASLALLGFGTGMALLGVIPFGGTILENGTERVKIIANAIKDTSFILSGGKYDGGPTAEWAGGIGMAISAFAYALSVSAASSLLSGNYDPNSFSNFMIAVATSMISVAEILKNGDWSGAYPSKQWGEGVSTSLIPFIDAYKAINERKSFLGGLFGGESNDSFGELMTIIATSMVRVSNILKGGDFTGGPSEDWAKNIGGALSSFTTEINKLDDDKIDVIENFSDAIRDLANSIKYLNDSGLNKLNKLTTSITIMSVIDDKKLKDVLRVMDDNKDKLSNMIESSGGYTPTKTNTQTVSTITSVQSSKSNDDSQKKLIDLMDQINKKFDDLLEFVIKDESGKNVKTDDKT